MNRDLAEDVVRQQLEAERAHYWEARQQQREIAADLAKHDFELAASFYRGRASVVEELIADLDKKIEALGGVER